MVERLSRGNPGFRKILAIILIISAAIFGLLSLIVHLIQSEGNLAATGALVAVLVVVSAYLHLSSNKLKILSKDSDYLYIEDQQHSIKVPLDQLQEAHFVPPLISSRTSYEGLATILFKSDTVFGREITFIPIKGKKTVRELIELIVSIQDQESLSIR